ncbi:hypothetical protein LWM68_21160 [Niabella sp. W65]|nr:hypothetical protein [Niabella sp. W65]MCH7365043.1 hypothetical protein [Niabella sp. W65]
MRAVFKNLIALFFATSLLIPTLLINKVLFAVIIILMFFSNKPGDKIVIRNTYSPIIIFSIFLFGYFVSFLSYTDRDVSNQFLLGVLVLLLIYPIHRWNINIDTIVKRSGIFMCLYTALLLTIMFLFPGSSLQNGAIYLIYDASGGSFGMRSFTGEEKASFGLHLGTVPFLYLPFILYFYSFLKKPGLSSFFALVLLSIFIVISTSRGFGLYAHLAH